MEYVYTHRFDAPPEQVFACATDVDLQRSLDPRVIKAEIAGGGPVRAGARVQFAFAINGRIHTWTREVLAFDPDARTYETLDPVPGLGLTARVRTQVTACEGGSTIELRAAYEPRHLLGYLGILVFFLLGRPYALRREVQRWFVSLDGAIAERASAPQVAARGGTASRCPYCHTSVDAGAAVACTSCLSRHHAACWDEHGECASCGGRDRFAGVETTEGHERRRSDPGKEAV